MGAVVTPDFVWLFAVIAVVGVINFALGLQDAKAAERLNAQLSDVLAQIVKPPAPHLANLRQTPNPELKRMVDKLSSEMREFEKNSKIGDAPSWLRVRLERP
jgi:hypothetical protein